MTSVRTVREAITLPARASVRLKAYESLASCLDLVVLEWLDLKHHHAVVVGRTGGNHGPRPCIPHTDLRIWDTGLLWEKILVVVRKHSDNQSRLLRQPRRRQQQQRDQKNEV